MRRYITLSILYSLLLGACVNDNGNANNTIPDVFTKVYSTDNLKTQLFTIDNSIDNTITGKSGTVVQIPKNCFVDSAGKLVTGKISVELKEALNPIDRVMGNLTTVFDGKPLETGGMIYLNATSEKKELFIAKNKSLEVSIPADDVLENMSFFKGKVVEGRVNWSNPEELSIPKPSDAVPQKLVTKRITNVRFSVDGFDDAYDAPQSVQTEVGRICWSGGGLKIANDSVLQIEGYTVHFYKESDLNDSQEISVIKGENSFAEDETTSYIFSMKKLGWANIDRLLDDPRTEEVNLITTISNTNDFSFVYVSLITQNMYLPGYQKKDGTYGFSHDDNEPQLLPIGESATILATAYKDGKPYFALKKITITKNQDLTFTLLETTNSRLKADLLEKL